MTTENLQIVGILINSTVSILAVGITYIISSQNRWNSGVTQFRQQWINDLRNTISLYIAKAELISLLETNEESSYREHFKELAQTSNKIELLLNPTEDDHNEVIEKMNAVRELIHDETIEDVDDFQDKLDDLIDDLLTVSKRVLKNEWNVVKKGR